MTNTSGIFWFLLKPKTNQKKVPNNFYIHPKKGKITFQKRNEKGGKEKTTNNN